MKINLLVVAGIAWAALILAVLPAHSADSLTLKEGGGMKLSSPEFTHNTHIPKDFTCEGDDINPSLTIEGIPSDAKTLVLIVDDPDAPGKTWVHWVVFDIPVTGSIGKDTVPGQEGMNDFGRLSYGGPCPPQGTHRYFFKAYALDKVLGLPVGIDKAALEQAMQGHILAQAELIGLYRRARR